jgi:hypothetical protein
MDLLRTSTLAMSQAPTVTLSAGLTDLSRWLEPALQPSTIAASLLGGGIGNPLSGYTSAASTMLGMSQRPIIEASLASNIADIFRSNLSTVTTALATAQLSAINASWMGRGGEPTTPYTLTANAIVAGAQPVTIGTLTSGNDFATSYISSVNYASEMWRSNISSVGAALATPQLSTINASWMGRGGEPTTPYTLTANTIVAGVEPVTIGTLANASNFARLYVPLVNYASEVSPPSTVANTVDLWRSNISSVGAALATPQLSAINASWMGRGGEPTTPYTPTANAIIAGTQLVTISTLANDNDFARSYISSVNPAFEISPLLAGSHGMTCCADYFNPR